MRSRYDAVVVGGGHNGLVAAAYLARAGRSVLLLERSEALGGASVSAELFAGRRARVSRYAYLVSLLPELIVRELGLTLTLARRRPSSYTPDPRAAAKRGLLVDDGDAAATRESFTALAGPNAQSAWERFYAISANVARAVFATLTEPLLSRAALRARIDDEQAWRALFEEPLGGVLARELPDELLSGVALTDGLIGTFAGGGDQDLRQNRCFLYHVIGRGSGRWLVPVGGMGVLPQQLADAARAAGAELATDTEALALEPERDQVAARIRTPAGERTVSAAHVLAGLAPAELARLCPSAAPSAVPAEGCQLKVNMLLARLPRLRDPGVRSERAFAGTFHANETAGQLERARAQAAAGQIPEEVPCECYCHTLTDSSILSQELRDAGAQTLTVFALHMPARLFDADNDATRELAAQATLRSLNSLLAEPLQDCLLDDAHSRPCIETRTPLDIERELRMPRGNIFHSDLQWPFAEREEDVGRWGVETPEPRVLLCGAGARRGGGVSGIPGRNAAMALLGR